MELERLRKNTTIYKLMQNAKRHIVPSVEAPQLEHFKISHFSEGAPVATLGTAQDQQVFLHALVALYEIDYPIT